MYYDRVKQIQDRFNSIRFLIHEKRMNTDQLAAELNLSRSTILRCIRKMKSDGFHIRVVRDDTGWHHEIASEQRGHVIFFPNRQSEELDRARQEQSKSQANRFSEGKNITGWI